VSREVADSLSCYCDAIVTHQKASPVLAKSPILVKGVRALVKNPALQVQRDSAAQIRAFAQEFGLTPSSRTGVQTRLSTDEDENNPFGSPYGKGNPFAG
jgi:P27 family predicted phage terminase small subunit